jgi:hypothetical protein
VARQVTASRVSRLGRLVVHDAISLPPSRASAKMDGRRLGHRPDPSTVYYR